MTRVPAIVLRCAFALVAALGLALALRVTFALPHPEAAAGRVVAAAPPAFDEPRLDADSLARLITTRNPFRAHRSPASARYSVAAATGLGGPPTPPLQRPTLFLSGVLLGDEPVALIDGLPGFEHTRAVRLGETVAGYRLRELSADRAIIAGPDTTFVLPVRIRVP